MTEKPVYLCHASEDKDFADKLTARLNTNGYPVYVAPHPAGDQGLDKETRALIDAAQCVLVVVSKKLYTSRQAVWEFLYASSIDKRWIPVVLEQPPHRNTLSVELQTQWANFKNDISLMDSAIRDLEWVVFTHEDNKFEDLQFQTDFRTLQQTIRDSGLVIYDAFISYSRLNESVVRAFKSQLEEAGYRLWFDKDRIPKARPWLDEIKTGIDRSNHSLLFVTSSWLGSENCDDEWQYAQQQSKNIIPIFFAEAEVDDRGQHTPIQVVYEPNIDSSLRIYNARIANGDWEKLGKMSNAQVQELFEERLAKLHALNPIIIPPHYLTNSPGQISDNFFEDVIFQKHIPDRLREPDDSYLTKHTQLLVQAVEYEQGQRALLGVREWWREREWLRQNQNRVPPPSNMHREYVFRSGERLASIAFAVSTVFLAVFASLGFLFSALTLTRAELAEEKASVELARADLLLEEAEAERALNAEINNALQREVQSAQQRSINLNGSPRRPVPINNTLWVSLDDRIQQLDPGGTVISEVLSAGRDVRTPIYDGQRYLWAVSSDKLTRIDTTGQQPPRSQIIGAELSDPILISDSVWVHSGVSNTLTRVRSNDGEIDRQMMLTPDEQIVVAGGGYLWSWDDNRLRRISPDAVEQFFSGFGSITSVTFAGDWLWLIADGKLHRVDSSSGISLASTAESAALEAPVLADTTLWSLDRTSNQVYGFEADTLALRYQFSVLAPHRIFFAGNRLWVFTSADELHIYDAAARYINSLNLVGSNRVETLVSDGENVWFAPADQGTVSVVRVSNGLLFRRFNPCDGPVLSPEFDGASMWFACPENAEVVSMPAFSYFFGERTLQPDTEEHHPVMRGQCIWMTQEATGRLLVYDTVTREGGVAADFDGTLLPLLDDPNGYLWTVVANTGEIVRITPEAFNFDDAASTAHIQTLPLGHSVYGLHLVKSVIWALHNDMDNQSPNYSVIQQNNLQVVDQERLTLAPMGLTYADDYVWMPVSSLEKGMLYRIDAQSGLNPTLVEIEDTDFGAWPGLLINDDLWFNIVVPPTDLLIQQLAGMILPNSQLDNSNFSVRQFDPKEGTWGQRWSLPGATGQAVWDKQYLWYTLLTAPSVPVVGEQESGIGKFALRLSDGSIIPDTPGGWTFCAYNDPVDGQPRYGTTGNMYLVGDLLFSGCLDNARDVAVFTYQPSPALLHVHRDVGLSPWSPASDGETVWMTFRDSDNVAVFDADNGNLLRLIPLQNAPVPPLINGDSVWIYHSGDDVLQRIALQP